MGQRLNIVIMTIGSRGDIQGYLQIGKVLKVHYGHRVRIATHPRFKDLVEQDALLEFHSIGGDPTELVSYRLKDFTSKVKAFQEVLDTMLKNFVGLGDSLIDSPKMGKAENHPLVADAIIATPPCYAHIHCAERLEIPLHIMSATCRTPTVEIPHPQAIFGDYLYPSYANFCSYQITEWIFSLALGGLLNNLRFNHLGLDRVCTVWAPSQFYRMRIPHTYLWSPNLLPKPADWGPEIDVAGFVLDPAKAYTPPQTLLEFLDAGKPPVYVGFGSMVASNVTNFTALILEAIDRAGVRAIIGRGWSNLPFPDSVGSHIYVVDEIPHEWLFPRVSIVIHHGGLGTTSVGLRHGRPTVIVPFSGDQFFWGYRIAKAGAGALAPVPFRSLTAEKLAQAIQQASSTEALSRATQIAVQIRDDFNGAEKAAESFSRNFAQQTKNRRCCMLEDRLAVLQEKETGAKMSALAAYILIESKAIERRHIKLFSQVDWSLYACSGASPSPRLAKGLARFRRFRQPLEAWRSGDSICSQGMIHKSLLRPVRGIITPF